MSMTVVRSDRRVHTAALVAITLGAAYLAVRLAFTRDGADPALFWMLFTAEAFGWLTLVLFAHEAWVLPATPSPEPLDVPVDILLPTYDEPRHVLEATFVGIAGVRGRITSWVLDDGERPWVRELATSFGMNYVARTSHEHAKAGNINHALPLLDGDLICPWTPITFRIPTSSIDCPGTSATSRSASFNRRRISEIATACNTMMTE